jgi:hypothetical protein
MVCDLLTNWIRVVKTTKQTLIQPLSYLQTVRLILNTAGLHGLFFRAMWTRMLVNGLQSMMFTVLWKYLLELFK